MQDFLDYDLIVDNAEIKLKSVDLLKSIAKKLGVKVRNQTTQRWYAKQLLKAIDEKCLAYLVKEETKSKKSNIYSLRS